MDASQTCEFLLSSLKKSNLNFQLSESPFSVSIQLKKPSSEIKFGTVRSSGLASNLSSSRVIEEIEALNDEKRELEETISDYESLESSQIELQEKNKSLLDQVSKLQLNLESLKVDMGRPVPDRAEHS